LTSENSSPIASEVTQTHNSLFLVVYFTFILPFFLLPSSEVGCRTSLFKGFNLSLNFVQGVQPPLEKGSLPNLPSKGATTTQPLTPPYDYQAINLTPSWKGKRQNTSPSKALHAKISLAQYDYPCRHHPKDKLDLLVIIQTSKQTSFNSPILQVYIFKSAAFFTAIQNSNVRRRLETSSDGLPAMAA
jgi:hypothetical protein